MQNQTEITLINLYSEITGDKDRYNKEMIQNEINEKINPKLKILAQLELQKKYSHHDSNIMNLYNNLKNAIDEMRKLRDRKGNQKEIGSLYKTKAEQAEGYINNIFSTINKINQKVLESKSSLDKTIDEQIKELNKKHDLLANKFSKQLNKLDIVNDPQEENKKPIISSKILESGINFLKSRVEIINELIENPLDKLINIKNDIKKFQTEKNELINQSIQSNETDRFEKESICVKSLEQINENLNKLDKKLNALELNLKKKLNKKKIEVQKKQEETFKKEEQKKQQEELDKQKQLEIKNQAEIEKLDQSIKSKKFHEKLTPKIDELNNEISTISKDCKKSIEERTEVLIKLQNKYNNLFLADMYLDASKTNENVTNQLFDAMKNLVDNIQDIIKDKIFNIQSNIANKYKEIKLDTDEKLTQSILKFSSEDIPETIKETCLVYNTLELEINIIKTSRKDNPIANIIKELTKKTDLTLKVLLDNLNNSYAKDLTINKDAFCQESIKYINNHFESFIEEGQKNNEKDLSGFKKALRKLLDPIYQWIKKDKKNQDQWTPRLFASKTEKELANARNLLIKEIKMSLD